MVVYTMAAMAEIKPHRFVVRLTDEQDEAVNAAEVRFQGRSVHTITRQSLGEELLADFCRSQGVNYPMSTRHRRPIRTHSHCSERAKRHR